MKDLKSTVMDGEGCSTFERHKKSLDQENADSSSHAKRRKGDGAFNDMPDNEQEVKFLDQAAAEMLEIENSEEREPLTIDDLFDELLQKIFSYFQAQDVFGCLSKVCMRWERVAKDPCTLNQTQLILEDKNIELCTQVLKEASCIGEVYILPSYPPDALNHLIRGPRIKKLVIIGDSEWHPTWPSPSDLIALLDHNKLSLQQLSMPVDSGLVHCHKQQLPETGGPSFQSILAGMKRLTHLHMVGECWRDWDEWDLTKEHPHLRTLKIDSVSFISEECLFIRDLIMLCKSTLRTLHLPCQLPHDAVSLLDAGIFQGSQVEELMVSTGCLRVISQMPHLKVLAVFDNGKEDRDLEWFRKMPMLSGVWKLTLQSVLETEGEKEGFVWHLLSKFNHLTEFWGFESTVEENTFNMFLNNNPLLKEMHFFDFNGFDNPSQVSLLDNCLPKIAVIDLSSSHVTEEMRKTLDVFNEKRPNVKILYDDNYDDIEMIFVS